MKFQNHIDLGSRKAGSLSVFSIFCHKGMRSVKCLKFGVPKVTDYFSTLAHFRHFISLKLTSFLLVSSCLIFIFFILAYLHILFKNEKYAVVIRQGWILDRPVKNVSLRLIRQIREFFKIRVAFFS